MSRTWSLEEIAQRLDLEIRGDGSTAIRGVASLAHAGRGDISFLARSRHAELLAGCQASAVIVRPELADQVPCAGMLVADDPAVAFAHAAALFQRPVKQPPGIHPTAVVDPQARIDKQASIGAYCVVSDDVEIGAGAVIDAGCHIGPGCVIGPHCHLMARVTLVENVHLGARVAVHSGAILGSDGFGLAWEDDHWLKVPQLGRLLVGDDCEIGANTCIDRGALDDTVLEHDVRLDNMIHIAHNVQIGAHTAMAGCAAVAGSARIGRYCQIGGGAGILGHITVADRVTITARTLVTHSIHESGTWSSGTPLQENRLWRRNAVRLKQLDEIARRVAKLEKDTGHD
ncbi:MAG: UDP-3-O-(3-hydroxymyristoyl)glucosamine N-acyltransferase [Rhodanobacteraceae bacterium]